VLFGLTACASAPKPEWPTASPYFAPSSQVSVAHRSAPAPSDVGASALLEASFRAIGAGLFENSLAETPDRTSNKAYGLGVELSSMIDQGFYGDIGYWVLEESKGEENDVGRFSLGLGYAEGLGEATAAFVRAGFEWERGRKHSANFLSLIHEDDTLFGGDENEVGFSGELGLRHRASSHLEIVAGVRGETLRKDSVGWFAMLRGFITPNFALLVGFEDTDEETLTLGLAVVF
jgi:hypothetical protein